MKDKEKTYALRISETELKNPKIRSALIELIGSRVKFQKHKTLLMVSEVEALILRRHYSWADVELYCPNKKDRLKGEVGKYNGKRCVIRGRK